MYEFFKTIIEKNTCKSEGICSIHPSMVNLNELLLSEVREISFYLVKLKEFGLINQISMDFCIEILSIFLINTNFNKEKYLQYLKNLNNQKKEVKEKYIEYCSLNNFPCETINSINIPEKITDISELMKESGIKIANRQKNVDKTKQRLFELITIFTKLCAINISKIKKYEENYNEFDYELIRFFALTNGYSIRNEKIIRRIKEFCDIAISIRKKLNEIYETSYGKKENAQISVKPKKGHCILIAGNDYNELENLLNTLENEDFKEKINVYTSGNMINAHFFPYFKNNKFLKGHIETDDIQYDFATFPGSILITKNFIQKIDSLYRGQIFSNKTISFDKIYDIKGSDYKALIKSAFELEGFKDEKNEEKIELIYDINNLNETLKNIEDKEIIVIFGNETIKEYKENYQNKKIINLKCPMEADILNKTIEILEKKNINSTFFFTHCDLESLETILSLINKEIKLYLNDCYFVLINPHVIESLKNDFNVNII